MTTQWVPADTIREAMEQTAGMEDPLRYHTLCTKLLSAISAVTVEKNTGYSLFIGEDEKFSYDLSNWDRELTLQEVIDLVNQTLLLSDLDGETLVIRVAR